MGPSKRMRSLLSDCSKPDDFAGFVRNSEAFAIAQFSLAATCHFSKAAWSRECNGVATLVRFSSGAALRPKLKFIHLLTFSVIRKLGLGR